MLDEQQKRFVDEYVQTYSVEDSAIRAGYDNKSALKIGLDLLANETIQKAIKERERELTELSNILTLDKTKLLMSMYFQYNNATRRRDTKSAVDILERIAKWSGLNPDEVVIEPVQLIINNVNEEKI